MTAGAGAPNDRGVPQTPVPPPLTGPFATGRALAPLANPTFRSIWTANLLSNMGSMVQGVAAAWLMTELTQSHLLIALVQASTTMPILLFGVFAGAIADNFDRRRVMLVAQAAMLAVSALLAVVTWQGAIAPWSLLLLTLLVGTGTALNGPAWQASVRAQVGRADLPQAVSLNSIAFNLARSMGPALGGLLISLWNVGLAFAVNAVSYVVLIAVLLRWKPAVAPPVRRPMLPSIAQGLRFCAGSRPVRRVLMRGAVIGIGFAGFQALLPALVRERLHGSEVDYGLMLGAFGLCSILAALAVSTLRRRYGTEAVMAIGTLAFAAAIGGLLLASDVAHALPASALAGMGWVTAFTTLNVAMQVRSPEHILGRCMAIYQAVTFGGLAIGAWAWGALSDYAGLAAAMIGAAVWLVVLLGVMRLAAPMPVRGEGVIDSA